jgi:hypothetical protein
MSLAAVADQPLMNLFGHPITLILLACTLFVVLSNMPLFRKKKKAA